MKSNQDSRKFWNKVIERFHKFFFLLISTGILASGASFTCPGGVKGDEPPVEAPTHRDSTGELDTSGGKPATLPTNNNFPDGVVPTPPPPPAAPAQSPPPPADPPSGE